MLVAIKNRLKNRNLENRYERNEKSEYHNKCFRMIGSSSNNKKLKRWEKKTYRAIPQSMVHSSTRTWIDMKQRTSWGRAQSICNRRTNHWCYGRSTSKFQFGKDERSQIVAWKQNTRSVNSNQFQNITERTMLLLKKRITRTVVKIFK